MWRSLALFILFISSSVVHSVDRNNFKTCQQSSFCNRLRSVRRVDSPYYLDLNNFKVVNDSVIDVRLIRDNNEKEPFILRVSGIHDRTFRVKIFDPVVPRYHYNSSISFPYGFHHQKLTVNSDPPNRITVSTNDGAKLVFTSKPIRIDVYYNDQLRAIVNSRSTFEFERTKIAEKKGNDNEEKPGEDAPTNPEDVKETPEEAHVDQNFEERFKEHVDTRKNGPSAIGLDITYVGYANLFGIPEHADSFRLRSTKETDPYRMYNLDVFEYELNNPMALYGASPLLLGHKAEGTIGVFYNNPSEMWIDIEYEESESGGILGGSSAPSQAHSHWMVESGIVDLFIFLGPKPQDVLRQYTAITGRPALPRYFAIGYHQCRWNYNDEQDVKQVDENFDLHDIPYDALWLDIEHTDDKRYMTWDKVKFANPVEMINNVASKHRKMITIVDPHIKADNNYHVYKNALDNGYFVKNKDGSDFEGWCWPGASRYIDFLRPEVRDWWSDLQTPENYVGSTLDLYTWNDMNEPSVFNGPEVTMHKDCLHAETVEHRDIHNAYGLLQVDATYNGQIKRSNGELRPFILSRSFYSGIQRVGAVWTGDNFAQWSHLKMSIPMLLSLSVAGVQFVGADVGGFFSDPDPELLLRWYQTGAFQPFFRAHAHIHTKRREPWLFDDRIKAGIRNAVLYRQSFAPYWYTLFYESHKFGTPPMRPIWWHFPSDEKNFAREDAYLVGNALLVRPISEANQASIDMQFPGDSKVLWYDATTFVSYEGGSQHTLDTPLSKIPHFYKDGSIVPRRERYRRSLMAAINDPITLIVVLNRDKVANGTLFLDDGESFQFTHGKYILSHFAYANDRLHIRAQHSGSYETKVWLEKVVVVGHNFQPGSIEIHVTGGANAGHRENLDFAYDDTKQILYIRRPGVNLKSESFIVIRPRDDL